MSGIEDFNIYLAKGKSLEIAEAHFAKRDAANKARAEHAKKHGGPGALPYGDDFTYLGITTPNPPDAKAWQVSPKSRTVPQDAKWPCYVPNTRTKEGKALEAEMGNKFSGHGFHDVFSRPDNECFSDELGLGPETGVSGGGLCLLYARVGKVGGEVVILVPKALKTKAVPPDAEPIKPSRYYALVEAAEEKKSA